MFTTEFKICSSLTSYPFVVASSSGWSRLIITWLSLTSFLPFNRRFLVPDSNLTFSSPTTTSGRTLSHLCNTPSTSPMLSRRPVTTAVFLIATKIRRIGVTVKVIGRNGRIDRKDRWIWQEERAGQNSSLCHNGSYQSYGYRHLPRDSTSYVEDNKADLLNAHVEEKARIGPPRSTRSQKAAIEIGAADGPQSNNKKFAGRLEASSGPSMFKSFSVTLSDGKEFLTTNGHTGNGSDESIASFNLAESAAYLGIGKITKNDPISLQVALKNGEDTQKVSFLKTITAPRAVLRLAAASLVSANVSFLIADADLAVEDLLIDLPVLQHLGINTKTLLGERRDLLD